MGALLILLGHLLVLKFSNAQELPTCRDDFAYHRGYCFSKTTVKGGGSWDESAQACSGLGLGVTLSHPYPHDLVNWQGAMMAFVDDDGYGYVGASRLDNGTWIWVDDTLVEDEAWPLMNPPGPPAGKCAYKNYDSPLLNANPCDSPLTPPTICQVPALDATNLLTTFTDAYEAAQKAAITLAKYADAAFKPEIVRCPSGFQEIGGCCYLFSETLETTRQQQNWQGAQDICKDIGHSIGTTINLAEVGTVNSCNPMKLTEAVARKGNHVWLGATDGMFEGDWIWQQTNKTLPIDSNMWWYIQPDNWRGIQHCLKGEIYNSTVGNPQRAYLNDYQCEEVYHYVCQKF